MVDTPKLSGAYVLISPDFVSGYNGNNDLVPYGRVQFKW